MTNSLSAPAIIIKNAYLAYQKTVIFNQLNMTISAGKCTCLLGPSGVGKSTLLRIIADLIINDGNTHFHGTVTSHYPIAYMAQTDLLMPWLTVLDNTLLSFRLQNQLNSEKKERAIQLLQQVGLTDAIQQYPQALSGGMRQRVALVRTFIQEKDVILMDEPFSALDAITRLQLQTLATTLFKNRTVLFITHDPIEALRIADEIYILSGQPAVLTSPFTLNSETPRDPAAPEFIQYQAELFHALMQAKEINI